MMLREVDDVGGDVDDADVTIVHIIIEIPLKIGTFVRMRSNNIIIPPLRQPLI